MHARPTDAVGARCHFPHVSQRGKQGTMDLIAVYLHLQRRVTHNAPPNPCCLPAYVWGGSMRTATVKGSR